MPTPTGLPKVGEVWERKFGYPRSEDVPVRFVVLRRSAGEYWALWVYIADSGKSLWPDASYWMSQGELKYIGPAGPETKKRFGLA
jgi:hypothetical protein